MNEEHDGEFAGWHTAEASEQNGGQCVEVGYRRGSVSVRDSKDRSKPAHIFTVDEWRAFLDGAKKGEFDV